MKIITISEHEEKIDGVDYIIKKDKIILEDGTVMNGSTRRHKTLTPEQIEERDEGFAYWAIDVIERCNLQGCIKEIPLEEGA